MKTILMVLVFVSSVSAYANSSLVSVTVKGPKYFKLMRTSKKIEAAQDHSYLLAMEIATGRLNMVCLLRPVEITEVNPKEVSAGYEFYDDRDTGKVSNRDLYQVEVEVKGKCRP